MLPPPVRMGKKLETSADEAVQTESGGVERMVVRLERHVGERDCQSGGKKDRARISRGLGAREGGLGASAQGSRGTWLSGV